MKASTVIKQARQWLNYKESDGTHKKIIDIYNLHKPRARGYKVTYKDKWCATFISSLAIKCDCTDIIPTECSCGHMITLHKKLGTWIEDDGTFPKMGDLIFYDWDDSGTGECTGYPEHVGIVEGVEGRNIIVIEGNYENAVKRRTISVDAVFIRGFARPKYEPEGSENVSEGSEKVLDYAKSKSNSLRGNYIATTDLYMRFGASKEKDVVTVIKKGDAVTCFGYYTETNGTIWLYVKYGKVVGFASSKYLTPTSRATKV